MDETSPARGATKAHTSVPGTGNIPDWFSIITTKEFMNAGTAVLVIALIVVLIRSLTALIKASRS